MITLILPCAGRNFINNQPRWTLKCSDKDILLTKCLNTLQIDKYDRIIVSIFRDDFSFFSYEKLVSILHKKVEIFVLDELTAGPADTVYRTIKEKGVVGAFQVKDIDIVFNSPCYEEKNFIAGIHLLNYESDLKNVKNKSFITRNEKNIVLDIIEKNIKSDIISIGLYGFKNSEYFISNYEKLKENFNETEAIYISHIIAYLIGAEKMIFDFIEIPSYILFESEKDYEKYLKNSGTYVIDLDNVNIKAKVSEIKKLYENGCKFIFLVEEVKLKDIEEFCSMNNFDNIIIIKNSSSVKKLISSEEELKEVYYNVM